MRIAGSMALQYGDALGVGRSVVAMVRAALTAETEGYAAQHPSDPSYEYTVPIVTRWSVDVAYNLDATAGIPHVTQDKLEDHAFSKDEFAVQFISDAGVYYTGTAFVTRFAIDTSEESAARATVQLTGNGPLYMTANLTTCGVNHLYTAFNPNDPAGVTVALGVDAGYVKITKVFGPPGTLEVYYDSAQEVDEEDYDDIGQVHYWYYDPGVSGPYTARFNLSYDGAPLNPTWILHIECPTPTT